MNCLYLFRKASIIYSSTILSIHIKYLLDITASAIYTGALVGVRSFLRLFLSVKNSIGTENKAYQRASALCQQFDVLFTRLVKIIKETLTNSANPDQTPKMRCLVKVYTVCFFLQEFLYKKQTGHLKIGNEHVQESTGRKWVKLYNTLGLSVLIHFFPSC